MQRPLADTVLLLIEVSDTTLSYDRGRKLRLYAREGIVEYWILNVDAEKVLVFREASAEGNRTTLEFGIGDAIAPLLLPAIQLRVAEIFG